MLPSFPLLQSNAQIQDSPLLDLVVLYDRYMLAGSMSGRLILYDAATDQITDQRKDHSKYLVKIATWPEEEGTLIATAGWDSKVHIYRLTISAGVAQLGEPLSPLTLQSIPETVLFIQGPGHSSPLLVLSRRDSTFLYYYALSTPPAGPFDISLLGKQNLAPHSNAWVAFSPADVQLCPSDSSIAAVATSSTPHMKLLVVRLLVPPSRQSTTHSVTDPGQDLANSSGRNTGLSDTATPPATQAAQARAELLIQDREEAAILLNINTMSPQTAYSTPKLAWRPDGSGIYVTSDDGVIRGFEASTGKHIATLTAHEPATKVRCLWAGSLEGDVDNGKECLISGGFDRRLILWRTG
jgi:WD40 repeat protein